MELKLRQGTWVVVCDGRKTIILENVGDEEYPDLRTMSALEAEDAAALPGREALSTVSGRGMSALLGNLAMPINEAVAVNNESTSSYAIADADQIVVVDQSSADPMEGWPGEQL